MGMFNRRDFIKDNTEGVISVVDFGDLLEYCHDDVKVKNNPEDIRDYKREIDESDMEVALFSVWPGHEFITDVKQYFNKIILVLQYDELISFSINDLNFDMAIVPFPDNLIFAIWNK